MGEHGTGTGGGKDFKAEMESLVEGAQGLFGTLKEIFDKSRDEIARASRLGKTRIDLFQLDKDREHVMQELGQVTFRLMKAGTLAHDDLRESYEKLQTLAARRAEFEAEIERVAEEQAAAEASKSTGANDAPKSGPASKVVELAVAGAEIPGVVAGESEAVRDDGDADASTDAPEAPARKPSGKKGAKKEL